MATAEPDVDVIAVEVYRRGLAQLLSAIDREGITNIRLVRGDGIDVLQHMFGPESLTGVRVFFPDPWPKARHHKRRLLQPDTIALIADRLRQGGVLHAATDHPGYAEQIAECGDAEARLRRVSPDNGLPISVTRPLTKYETKAQDAGSAVAELVWEKRQT
jgi:tRNA (guanine-N7-)-methyltransferase